MPHVAVPDQDPFAEFTVGGSPTTDFAIGFTFFDKSDLRVTVNGVDLAQSAFDANGTAGYIGGFPGGTVVLHAAVSNANVRIWSEMPPSRTNDFNQGAGFPADSINTELDRATARQRDMRLRMRRTPVLALTANKTLAASDAGQIFTNQGAAGAVAVTLPPASAGLTFTFAVTDAQQIAIGAAAGDSIQDASSIGAALSSASAGSVATLAAIDGTAWLIESKNGTWALV